MRAKDKERLEEFERRLTMIRSNRLVFKGLLETADMVVKFTAVMLWLWSLLLFVLLLVVVVRVVL